VLAWVSRPRVRTYWQWALIGGLMVTYVSALPYGIPLISYGLSTVVSVLARRRIWRTPILVMLATTFVGTLVSHGLSYVSVVITGVSLSFLEVINRITLPSLVLNIILAIPIYALLGDLANWFYPEELTV
jgi:cell shape-determining protein MreD